jgi:hypothetical protein
MRKFGLATDIRVILPDDSERRLMDYLLPTSVLMFAALLLMVSVFLPYWKMQMFAPQYPNGLTVSVYINQLEGDVREIDALNHYLGMPPLDEGGQLERSISLISIVSFAMLLVGGVFVHNKWAAVLVLPVIAFPVVFLADLWLILYRYGHSIDPTSPLGGAIDPFTPPLLGVGNIGQFKTIASFGPGLYLAIASAVIVLCGLWLHRAAYKPVEDARKRAALVKTGAGK